MRPHNYTFVRNSVNHEKTLRESEYKLNFKTRFKNKKYLKNGKQINFIKSQSILQILLTLPLCYPTRDWNLFH